VFRLAEYAKRFAELVGDRRCHHCRKPLSGRERATAYCGPQCSQAARQKRHRMREKEPTLRRGGHVDFGPPASTARFAMVGASGHTWPGDHMSNDALDDRPCSIARVDLVFGRGPPHGVIAATAIGPWCLERRLSATLFLAGASRAAQSATRCLASPALVLDPAAGSFESATRTIASESIDVHTRRPGTALGAVTAAVVSPSGTSSRSDRQTGGLYRATRRRPHAVRRTTLSDRAREPRS